MRIGSRLVFEAYIMSLLSPEVTVFTLLVRGIVEHRTAMWELEEISL